VSLAARVALAKGEALLLRRLEALQARLEAGDDAAWDEYRDVLRTLAAVAQAATPGAAAECLTTKQMAERLNVSVKTLLRHKAAGKIRPAVEAGGRAKGKGGKLLRWTGRETL
jgi:hypothetical protein